MLKFKKTNGFTFIEMSVVLIIIAVISVIAFPVFHNVIEQSKVDIAGANLTSVWTAQRLYWAQNKHFADSLAVLNTAGYLDNSFMVMNNDSTTPFSYQTSQVGNLGVSFVAQATRRNSTSWSGSLSITETGVITGNITNGSSSLVPKDV